MNLRFFTRHPAVDTTLRTAVEQDEAAARLPAAFRTYYYLRPWIPIRVRQLLQKNRPLDVGPQWYLPESVFGTLASTIAQAQEPVLTIHPWPDGAQWALVLTHDVETAAGMKNVLRLAQIEEDLGLRSSWNLVPHKYPIDDGIVNELRARGFEIGIHGYNHDGRLYASRRGFERRAAPINAALQRYRAVGFRSPMVHRNLERLQSLHVEYDASCFDVDPFQAMPGGVGSIWPFMAGRFVELPYTLPQDHTLLVVLRETDDRIWRDKLDFLTNQHGMALMLTHPDYLTTSQHLGLYRDFLRHMQERGGFWHALPRDVAAWWRQRDASQLVRTSDGSHEIHGPAAERATVARMESDGQKVTWHRKSTEKCPTHSALGNNSSKSAPRV